jgi:hypothetical protein
MVKRAEAQFVYREASSADGAGDLPKGVEHRSAKVADAKNADVVGGRFTD